MGDLLKTLDERVVVGDGAMGTQIYAKGVTIGRCFDELNLTHPHLVRIIHREYAEAGADFLETNTFTANRLRLRKFELELAEAQRSEEHTSELQSQSNLVC